ncbi:hypothetical protein V1264_008615 [Littorina saxatilis]|uniref:Uncharacterized protein n=1 Tax=Littorina saxatilis TaxID=31220 RepID=A0AAN9G318_9CAEN
MAGTGGKQGYHRYAVSLVIFLLLETMAVEASTTQSTAAVYTTTVYADTATATTTTQITTTAATSQDVMSTDAITQSGDDESTDATSSPDFTSTGPTVYHDYLSTVAEGDSLTETTYSGGDSLVDTTTSLVYTSTDTTFAGDYTSADTATSSTGYQTSSQDSSSYQSPTSPYVTNYQDPTTAYADTATATTTTQITTTAATSQDVMSTDAITQSGDDESTDATSSPDFTSTGPTVSHDYLSTVAEGDSLTETTYSGGDSLVDTTTSLVYTSTDTTFAGDYTSADTATSSTGYQTSSQDSSSYQSPTSPYVTNYQDPTSTYSTSDQDPTSTYSTSDQDSTSTYSTSYQDPTSTYSTSDQDPTSTYSTSDQDPTSTYSTSDQDPTSTYSTSDQDSTSTYSTSYQDPTSTYSTSDQDPTSTYSTSYQDSTSTYSTSYQDPTSTYSTSDQDPTSTYSTSDQDPTSTYSTSDQDPTSTYSTSDQDPTSTYSTSYQDPTSTYSTSYQTPTSTYSTSYQTSTVDSSTTDATTTTMIYSTSTTAATGVTTEAASASDTITATGTPSVTGATSTSTATVTLAAVSTDSSTSVAGTTTNYTDSTVNGTTASTASEANETLTSSSPTTSWPETTTTATTTTGALTNCGGELQGVNGVILSPRYPNNYPHNTVCEWTLTARRGERIRVSFSDFDLEDSSTCEMDYLELREGPQSSRPNRRLDRLCGDALPFDVTSTDDVMSVTFVSNAQNSRSGFRANWTSLCEETHRGTWRSQSGTIQSSNSSGEIKDCTFIIEQWQGYIVKLEFSSFHLGTDETDCQIHHVEVRDGGFDGAPLLGQRFCGTSTPQALTSSQNMMWIRYVTDGSDAMAGFSATYTRENPSCGSVELREQRGSFTSPLYPNNYPNRMDCSWEIVAQENHVIQLTFDSFTLEGPSRCYWDWVYVYDGDTRIGGKYCGLSAPDTITSTGNRLKVEFRSDWIITFQGFSASYFTYDPYSDELTRQYDLYPYGEDQRDAVLRRAHDKSKRIYVDTGFPVGDQLHYKLFIANKGLVSFGKRDKGRKLKLKQHKAMICPYHSDIASPENNGGVYYQLHTDPAALTKASAEVREFSEYRQYNASLVLVVTWDNVSHVNSPDAAAEQATVQLALISDGRRSFGLVYYKLGGMKWSVLDNEPLVIGFSDGQQGQVIDSVYSHTAEAFTRLDKIKGNTGRYGMWIYPVGDSYSADQQCQDWYTRNLPLKNARLSAFQRLPQCPCSWWFIWGNWRFSQWRDGYNVLCFRMTVGRGRQFAPHGKECCYRWSWWWWWWSSSFGQFITNGPQAGSATAFNPAFWSLRRDYQQEDRLAHDVCCYNTTSDRYCNMYYELRPVGECSTRIPFSFSWTWGDPHIKTLDGGEYTFNGWGEYTMITLTSDDLNFTLQGRTGLAETENGSLTNATVFTAFGAEENGIRVFVGLDPNTNDSLIAYGNNTDYSTAFRDAGNDSVLAESESYMLKRSNDSFVVTFTSEIELTISIGFKALDISIGMPPGFKNKTRGLLGNFNDVKGDDFVLPDGTTLSADLTDRQIYEDFGPKWAVTVSDTVLRYEPREVPNDYAHPEFRPVFLDEVSTESREAAEDLCGATNVACIYDYVATGSTAIANATKATAKTADDRESVTKNTVPVLNFNGTVTGNSGENVTFNLQGHDPDADDVLTYHVVDDGNGTVYVDSNTGDVTLFVDSKRPVSLRFYAVDAANVQSPTRDVTLIACSNCSNHGSCNFSRTNTNITGFLVAACDCMPSWTGDDCEEEYDACEESPCDAFQTCTDLTAVDQGNNETGYTCTGCPAGFQTDPNDPTRYYFS